MVDYLELLHAWRRLQSFPFRDAESVQRFQFARFKRLLHAAYKHVPMYRQFYDEQGFRPAAVQRIEDIAAVPVCTKELVRRFPVHDRVATWARNTKLHRETTSGSTGEPTEIWTDGTESLIQTLKGIRALRAWGYAYRDNLVQIWRVDTAPKQAFVQRLGLMRREVVSILDEPDVRIARLMATKCDVLLATRSTLELVAEELAERGKRLHPRIVVCTSEVVTEAHRRLFRQAYGCEVMELYGTMETGTVGWACPLHPRNLHLETETVMAQYINERDDGGQRTAGLALTNLYNTAMPFIRFDPGDDVVIPENTQCDCGRKSPILGRVRGRSDDVIRHGDRRLNFHFFYNYFKDYLYVRRYKVVQLSDGIIEFNVQLTKDDQTNRQRCEVDLKRDFGPILLDYRIRFVDHFPRTRTGKFKVIEKLGPTTQ